MKSSLEALKTRMAEIGHLRRASAVLDWDLQTYMPSGGAPARAEQMGLLSRLAHEQFIAKETEQLLEQAETDGRDLDPDSEEARLLRNVRRDFDRFMKMPAELTAKFSRHAALTQEVWERARATNDFATFAPSLEKMLDLVREIAACLGYEDDPYDPLLDLYEPGAKTAAVAAMFATLKPFLVQLTQNIVERRSDANSPLLEGLFPPELQNALTLRIVQSLGYDLNRGRQDRAAHPFCTSFSRDDVRITTRFDERILDMAFYASLHEAGHAMYEQGIPAAYDNTPLGGATSMGFHESQSRLWENLVGRSRSFCSYILPQLKETFPGPLADVSVDRFYRAVNHVRPSLIRVEADEVTYNLHVLLRFELERDLLADRLKVGDLPQAWNAKMKECLGITPPDDTQGVLQDVHWSSGMIGYFPTYTIGTLLSAQLWHAVQKALPDLDTQIARGEFAPLLGWLRENIHHQGRKYMPDELILRATGEIFNERYYMDYLTRKFGDLYGLE